MDKHLRFWVVKVNEYENHDFNVVKRYYYLTTKNYLDIINKTKSKKSFKRLHRYIDILSIETYNKKIF